MATSKRTICTGSGLPAEGVVTQWGREMGTCPKCERVGRPTKTGAMRAHSVPGPNTASHDRLMSNLYAVARS